MLGTTTEQHLPVVVGDKIELNGESYTLVSSHGGGEWESSLQVFIKT